MSKIVLPITEEQLLNGDVFKIVTTEYQAVQTGDGRVFIDAFLPFTDWNIGEYLPDEKQVIADVMGTQVWIPVEFKPE